MLERGEVFTSLQIHQIIIYFELCTYEQIMLILFFPQALFQNILMKER